MKFYKCISVDTATQTWCGYALILTDGVYAISKTLTEGLYYSTVIPAIGSIYSQDALIKIGNYYSGWEAPTVGLIFYASLSEISDIAETGQAITIVGSVSYSVIKGIPCAVFSGINGYISSDGIDIPYASESRTISYWVLLTAGATSYDTSTIWGYGGGGDTQSPGGKYFSHTILPDAFHNLCGYNTWNTSDVYIEHSFSTEKWYHICQTSTDGQTFITYVNGTMIGSIKHENLNLP